MLQAEAAAEAAASAAAAAAAAAANAYDPLANDSDDDTGMRALIQA